MVTGLACQHWHRQEVEVLRTRDFRRSHLRRMPRLMPPDAARFFSYVEVFYEALPQTLLQLFVFLTGISDHFTGRDVLLSVGASLANVVLSLFEIERTARSLGIPAFDYMLFFISGSVGDILAEGIPLRRFLRNPSYDEADFSGFQTLYADPRALHAFETIFREAATPPPGTPATPSPSWWRTVILPRPHGDEEGWCYARFRETARMLVAGRMNPHHLTTVSGVVPARAAPRRPGREHRALRAARVHRVEPPSHRRPPRGAARGRTGAVASAARAPATPSAPGTHPRRRDHARRERRRR